MGVDLVGACKKKGNYLGSVNIPGTNISEGVGIVHVIGLPESCGACILGKYKI